MPRGPVLGALLASLLAGCATPQSLRATDLAARAEANPLAAQLDFARREIRVEGVVRQTSLVDRRSVVGTVGPFSEVTTEERHENLPVVILDPGSVLCYFDEEDLPVAAELRAGQTVRLDCRVDSFRVVNGHVLSVLAGCEQP